MLGEIFKKARQEIQNPATLKRLIVVGGSRGEGQGLSVGGDKTTRVSFLARTGFNPRPAGGLID